MPDRVRGIRVVESDAGLVADVDAHVTGTANGDYLATSGVGLLTAHEVDPDAHNIPAQIAAAGAGPATVIAGGNLGASPTLDIDSNARVIYTGTLTANCTLTVDNIPGGAIAFVIVTEDGTGNWTLAVDYGGDVESPTIALGAGETTMLLLVADDAGVVTIGPMIGPADADGADGSGGGGALFARNTGNLNVPTTQTTATDDGSLAVTVTVPAMSHVFLYCGIQIQGATAAGTFISRFTDGTTNSQCISGAVTTSAAKWGSNPSTANGVDRTTNVGIGAAQRILEVTGGSKTYKVQHRVNATTGDVTVSDRILTVAVQPLT